MVAADRRESPTAGTTLWHLQWHLWLGDGDAVNSAEADYASEGGADSGTPEFSDQQVGVHYSSAATDALAYAQDFLTIFKTIGWTVNDAESAEIVTGQSEGLAIIVSRGNSLPASAKALRDVLRIYGIEVETFCDSARNIASGSFVLAVGSGM